MICHQYKCVFVHIPKCAGQSIEQLFVKQVGLTWPTKAPLLLRGNNDPRLGPPRLAHLRAADYVRCKYLTQEMYDDYFTFSFVRDPYARAVSMYKYLGHRHTMPFRAFLTGVLEPRLSGKPRWFMGPQSEFVFSEDDTPLVDHIGRVENIEDDFRVVCERTGFPFSGVPHRNRSGNARPRFSLKRRRLKKYLLSRIRHIPAYERYQDYYDEESRAIVARLYQRDFRLLDYPV